MQDSWSMGEKLTSLCCRINPIGKHDNVGLEHLDLDVEQLLGQRADVRPSLLI